MQCDCCKKEMQVWFAKAVYTVPGYVYEWFYCSEKCKLDHKMQLLRGSGL